MLTTPYSLAVINSLINISHIFCMHALTNAIITLSIRFSTQLSLPLVEVTASTHYLRHCQASWDVTKFTLFRQINKQMHLCTFSCYGRKHFNIKKSALIPGNLQNPGYRFCMTLSCIQSTRRH